MSNKEGKLFLTRGVPGTHNVSFLKKTLNNDFLHSYNYIHKIREKYI